MNNIIDKYDLFIFDLDDTLVKTEKIHYNAWLLTLQKNLGEDFYISSDDFFLTFHSKNKNNIQNYLENLFEIERVPDIINQKNYTYLNIIKTNQSLIEMIEGCKEFIEKIIDNKKRFVIVSNSLKNQIDFFSELFPILKKSTKNYYRELFKEKKPDPECYLKVVNDFSNIKMVGFEDSITGVHALTCVPEICAYYINSSNYIHHNYILENYNVIHINNYKDLL